MNICRRYNDIAQDFAINIKNNAAILYKKLNQGDDKTLQLRIIHQLYMEYCTYIHVYNIQFCKIIWGELNIYDSTAILKMPNVYAYAYSYFIGVAKPTIEFRYLYEYIERIFGTRKRMTYTTC